MCLAQNNNIKCVFFVKESISYDDFEEVPFNGEIFFDELKNLKIINKENEVIGDINDIENIPPNIMGFDKKELDYIKKVLKEKVLPWAVTSINVNCIPETGSFFYLFNSHQNQYCEVRILEKQLKIADDNYQYNFICQLVCWD